MKKMIAAVLSAILLLASFAGCANSKTTEGGQTPSAPSASTQPSEEGAPTTEEPSATPSAPKGYLMQVGDKVFGMVGSTIADAKAALGEDCTVTEEASCFFEGSQDKNYTYDNLSVTTYQKDGIEYVYYIKLFNDLLSTPEGLSIGDTAEKVTTLYGEGYTVSGSYRCYEKEGMTLRIRVTDAGEVSGIDYTANNA